MEERFQNDIGTAEETAVPIEKEEAKFKADDFLLKVRPFKFEGKEYDTVDLRKLQTMTTRQIQRVETALIEEGLGTQAVWTSLRGATIIAAVLNEMPKEWLDGMSAKDGITVRNVVFAFFIGLV